MALFPYNDLDLVITGQTAQTATVNNILATTAGTAAIDTATVTNSYRSFSVQIISTGTGGTFIFEESFDNTTFSTISIKNTTNSTGTIITAAITATSSSFTYEGAIRGKYFRIRIATTITGGNIQAIGRLSIIPYQPFIQTISQSTAASLNATVTGTITANLGTGGTGATSIGKAEDAASASGDTGIFALGVRRDTPIASASATGDYQEITTNKWGAVNTQNIFRSAKTFSATANITIGTAATDTFVLPGNATNTVYVTKIIISGMATAASAGLIQLIRRSTALTGGTSSNMSVVGHDTTDTGISVPISYTINPTGGGSVVGTLRVQWLGYGSTTAIPSPIIWEFGDKGKEILLSGVAQNISINLNSTTPAGGNLSVTFEWVEI